MDNFCWHHKTIASNLPVLISHVQGHKGDKLRWLITLLSKYTPLSMGTPVVVCISIVQGRQQADLKKN